MRTPKLIAIAAVLLILAACKKYNFNGVQSPASVNVVNAMPTSNPMIPYFGKGPVEYYNTRVSVYYGSWLLFSPPVDSSDLFIKPITDTAFTVFQAKLNLVSGGIYSLFLAGDTTKPDTMWVMDAIPTYSDSSVGVRFVNLSLGGKAVSINIAGNDPIANAEVNNLGYLHITGFKKYLADATVPGSYNFEIHDQATGDSLTTFPWNYHMRRNQTIVIAGSTDPASATPLNIFTVDNF